MEFIDYHHLQVLQKPVKGHKQVKFPSEYGRTSSIAPHAAEPKHVAYPAVLISSHPWDYSVEETHKVSENNGRSLSNSYRSI